MAGNYYHDPRPFYGLSNHNLMSMDELFYGRREPPPWYQQQMPYGRFDDHPRSRSMEPHRPDQYIQREDQFREYRRPDMRDDVYIGHQHDMHGANKGQQKNSNQGGNNNPGNNHPGNNNHGNSNHSNNNHGNNNHGNNNHGNNNNGDNKGKNQQKHQNDSDKEDSEKSHKGGHHGNSNKSNNNHGHQSHNNDHGHGHSKSWSDNKGFHGGRGHGRHRRSLSLTQIVLKKLGLRDDSSSDSSDDDRHGSGHNKKGAHGRVQTKGDHKPYTVRFDDQFYGHSNQSHNKKGGGSEKLGEDHGSHGKKGGGQPQGILKTSKNKHGDDGSSSDEGHKNHGNGKGGNQHHGGTESGKKGGQAATKQLGRAQSMEFRVNLCCENCERKVKKALWKMDVDQVLCDQWNNRVVVTGNAKPESVLKKLRSVKKDTLLWHQHK